jgi:prophage tail gpP-like protein
MMEFRGGDNLQDLRENLRLQAYRITDGSYEQPVSEEELSQIQRRFIDNTITIESIEDEKREAAKQYKQRIKDLQAENKELRFQIKTGKVKRNGKLFEVADTERGIMQIFDNDGVLVEERRLTPEEKRTTGNLFVLSPSQKAV